MRSIRRAGILLALAAAPWGGVAAAQEDKPKAEEKPKAEDKPKAEEPPKPEAAPETGSRYEVLVTASRQQSTVFTTERAASVVGREEMRSRPPRTTADALDETEGVFLQRTGWNGGSPVIRGLTGQQVLLLVDGIRLNTTTTRTGPNSMLTLIDPYIVDAVEVVRGPGSALYGSDAIGGVVQVRTRHPAPVAGDSPNLGAGLRGIFASYDQSGQGSISASGNWGRYAVDTAFSIRHFNDLMGGSNAPQQPYTGYQEGNLYTGAGVDLGPGTLVAVYQGTRQYEAMRPDRSQPGDLRQIPEYGRDLAYLRYEGSHDARGTPLKISATASYQRQTDIEQRLRAPLDRIDRNDDTVDVLGVQASAAADAGRGGKVVGGVEGYFEWVGSDAQRGRISDGPGAQLLPEPELALFPGGSGAQSVAAYAQDDIDLLRLFGNDEKHPGRLSALIGLRGGGSFVTIGHDERLAHLYPQLGAAGVIEGHQEINPTWAGSLYLRYAPLSWLALSGGFSTGYRAPNVADYARLGIEGLGFSVPSANLRPEMAYSAEGGVRVASRRFEGNAYYAYTLINDVVASVPVMVAGQPCADSGCAEPFYGRQNASQARLHAVEAAARLYVVGGLSVYANLAYTRGDLDTVAPSGAAQSAPYYKIPPLNGLAAVQVRRPRSIFAFGEVALRWSAPQNRLGQADLADPRICLPRVPCTGTPGFAVLSLRGAARLSRQVYITAAVENVTDTTYRFHGSGIDGPGLGAVISLEATYF